MNTTFLLVMLGNLFACGPDFPNMMLIGGDDPLLVAPVANFRKEMARLNPNIPHFNAVCATNGHAAQTAEADLSDLERCGVSTETLVSYRAIRDTLRKHKVAIESWRDMGDPLIPRPVLATITSPQGLPREFQLYLLGAVAWYLEKMEEARKHWSDLLDLPEAERRFRSTWAAYMLAKTWEEENPAASAAYFRKVRDLVNEGFADSLGLASASYGWEARLALTDRRYAEAIDLYLQQLATGDASALTSLRWTAATALADPSAPLKKLALSPPARSVITAYLLSGGNEGPAIDMDSPMREKALAALAGTPILGRRVPGMHRMEHPGMRWLKACEDSKLRDAEAAEIFAAHAYQLGEFDAARRWLALARSSPAAQWLRAKLFLRDGDRRQAAALLAGIVRRMPVAEGQFAGSLYVPDLDLDVANSMERQVKGELGVLHLERREYREALDALLAGGYWIDAAYVAERVLTVDELKAHVDARWPTETRLRHLLARRLLRENRLSEAAAYFPEELRPACVAYVRARQIESDETVPSRDRAAILWSGAQIAREKGIELLATEVEPDWACYDGAYDLGSTLAERSTHASPDEVARAERHKAQPLERFHYRWTAASLAWKAASLMPDNNDETALVLWTAGSWLKVRDPKMADRFHKALVRRCRKTGLGEAADRRRWFPIIDENGRIVEPGPATTSKPSLVSNPGNTL